MKNLTLILIIASLLNAGVASSRSMMSIPQEIIPGNNSDTISNLAQAPETEIKDTTIKHPVDQETDEAFSEMENELDEMNEKNEDTDTTKIRIGKMKLSIVDDGNDIIINKNDDWDEDWTWKDDKDFNFSKKKRKNHFKPHWAGLSLGLNNFVTSDFSTNLPSGLDPDMQLLAVNTNNSLEFNLNIAQFGINLFNQNIGIASGVGFKWNNYKFRNSNTILVSDSTPLYYYENSEQDFKMSKLTTCYIIVPILLEFQIHTQEQPVYLSAGVEGGLKLGAWTKIKTYNDQKYKDKNDFHTVPWDYRLTARIGYGSFGLYGTYGMQSVFEKEKGPELHPVTLGMSLNF